MQTPYPLIAALQNPALYSHTVTGFQVIETHLSWIILTGNYAYKIKKPLNLGFQDFTTLEKRHHYCNLEVHYNQPLAHDLYWGVVAITGTPESPVLNEMNSASMQKSDKIYDTSIKDIPFEYAVKMKQFNPNFALNVLADQHQLPKEMIYSLAKTIAHFHNNQPKDRSYNDDKDILHDHNRNYGTPTNVFTPMQDNFIAIKQILNNSHQLKQLKRIQDWAHQTFEKYQSILTARKKNGYIRACHGDLHLGNIVLYNKKPLVFDCIEFNEDFRWIDVINDIGFLTMDLISHQLQSYKYHFLNTYLDSTLDYDGLILLPFYESYRAMVRAKIYLLQAQQVSEKNAEYANLMNQVTHYFDIAESCTLQKPLSLTITFGVSGSGKSHYTQQIAMKNESVCLRSDIFRKHYFKLDPFQHTSAEQQKDIYSEEATKIIYQQLVDTAEKLLNAHQSVIIDAACLKQWQRQGFLALAKKLNIPFKILSFDAPKDVLIARLKQRDQNHDHISDATETIVNDQLSQQEPLSEEELKFACLFFH